MFTNAVVVEVFWSWLHIAFMCQQAFSQHCCRWKKPVGLGKKPVGFNVCALARDVFLKDLALAYGFSSKHCYTALAWALCTNGWQIFCGVWWQLVWAWSYRRLASHLECAPGAHTLCHWVWKGSTTEFHMKLEHKKLEHKQKLLLLLYTQQLCFLWRRSLRRVLWSFCLGALSASKEEARAQHIYWILWPFLEHSPFQSMQQLRPGRRSAEPILVVQGHYRVRVCQHGVCAFEKEWHQDPLFAELQALGQAWAIDVLGHEGTWSCRSQ